MIALLRLLDGVRLHHAAPQVREAFRLYRELRLSGMVAGNLLHAYPHYQAVRRLLTEMRRTDPSDRPRLDDLLVEVRGHHAEWSRIRELERPITPWEKLDEPRREERHDIHEAGRRLERPAE